MADFGTGWNSGSCGPGDGGGTIRLDAVDEYSSAGYTVDDAWSEATQRWLTGGHTPLRPHWDCSACGRPSPCPAAKTAITQVLTGRRIATVMAEWMHLAAGDLPTTEPGALFDRFLLWTRRVGTAG
jgi:hypothetical protein